MDPGRPWKGVWRWYAEEMLECCETPLKMVLKNGVSLQQLEDLAICHGLSVKSNYYNSDISDFKNAIDQTAKVSGKHLIVSFSRTSMGQTGEGHFSPIAAYHPIHDLALVLDVARFKYPPYWASLNQLHASMSSIDPLTGRSRGYLLLSRSPESKTTIPASTPGMCGKIRCS